MAVRHPMLVDVRHAFVMLRTRGRAISVRPEGRGTARGAMDFCRWGSPRDSRRFGRCLGAILPRRCASMRQFVHVPSSAQRRLFFSCRAATSWSAEELSTGRRGESGML